MTCTFDRIGNELHIRVVDSFDEAQAKACMWRFCSFNGGRLGRLVFDLCGIRQLHTAGLGTMLYIRSCCQVSDEEAHIVYQHAAVGMTLRLANLDRWFKLQPQGAALHEDKIPWPLVQAMDPLRKAS